MVASSQIRQPGPLRACGMAGAWHYCTVSQERCASLLQRSVWWKKFTTPKAPQYGWQLKPLIHLNSEHAVGLAPQDFCSPIADSWTCAIGCCFSNLHFVRSLQSAVETSSCRWWYCWQELADCIPAGQELEISTCFPFDITSHFWVCLRDWTGGQLMKRN